MSQNVNAWFVSRDRKKSELLEGRREGGREAEYRVFMESIAGSTDWQEMLSFFACWVVPLVLVWRGEMDEWDTLTKAILVSYISHCIGLFALAQPESIHLLSNS